MTAAATPQRLWEIGDDLAGIGAEIEDAEGVLSPELEAKLDALTESFFEKVTRCALLVRDRRLEAEKAKAEKDRLAAIEKANARVASELLAYVQRCMERAGVDRVDTARARVRRYRNPSPTVTWTRALDELPETYRRVTVEADIAALKEDMKAGAECPDGFAVVYGHHVRIL